MLLIPLGWSTISLSHAMEMEQETHDQHQCEFYDVASQGITTSLNLPVIAENLTCVQCETSIVLPVSFKALPRSRSPPFSRY